MARPFGFLPSPSSSRLQSIGAVRGFTLIELLLSMSILTVLMLVVTNVISVVQKTWARSNSRISEFREARMALDTISRTLGQATLNTYWQADSEVVRTDAASQNVTRSKAYLRRSELQFICGQTASILGGTADVYPGHGIFFQATLGEANLTAGGAVNTENMVNLLCGRGYFVSWGDDAHFRPAFLAGNPRVRSRFRYRLMEYRPTAEKNRIYDAALRPIVDPSNPAVNHSKEWFMGDVTSATAQSTATETSANVAVIRPVADNVVCLVMSPQLDTASLPAGQTAASIAPTFECNSLLLSNPGAPTPVVGSQGTQHLLPPIIRLTMIVVDGAAGETLAENDALRTSLTQRLNGKFVNASDYDLPTGTYHADLADLEAFFVQNRLNYRIFATTIVIKHARWST